MQVHLESTGRDAVGDKDVNRQGQHDEAGRDRDDTYDVGVAGRNGEQNHGCDQRDENRSEQQITQGSLLSPPRIGSRVRGGSSDQPQVRIENAITTSTITPSTMASA